MLKFGYTILYVSDVVKSIEFYEKAFGFERKFISPDNEYGELISGETTLSFASVNLAKTNFKNVIIESNIAEKPFAIEIGFVTENVAGAYNHAMEAGAISVSEPKEKPWGQTVSYVRDMDGFLIEICSPVV